MSRAVAERDKEKVRAFAASLGFSACGFTNAGPLDCGPLLAEWVGEGRHGVMSYLEREPERRWMPTATLPNARSVIVTTWPYAAPPPARSDWRRALTGRIAAYALGVDYHEEVGERLRRLASFVTETCAGATQVQVDGGPLVEKDLARRAGLGWFGHNTNILSRQAGSYFLLGCLLTEAEFLADPPFNGGHCGTCRVCLPACPTGALDTGPTIDAVKCISYLTIEYRGPIAVALRPALGNWVFGCDVCQEVCPWNADAEIAAGADLEPWLPGLLAMSEQEFRDRYGKTAVVRSKRRGLARSAAVALGNSGNPEAIDALGRAIHEHEEPLVRSHAAWALGQLATPEAYRELLAADASEKVPPVRHEIATALGEIRRHRGADDGMVLLPPRPRE